MKKPLSRIREEIARLQDQLKQAETLEAERIGRIALKAGIGEVEIDEADLQTAFEEIAEMFRAAKARSAGKKQAGGSRTGGETSARRRTDRLHRRQSSAQMRARDLVPA